MKLLRINLLCCIFISIALQCHAQIKYPFHVLPGQKFNVVSTTDSTFWVLKESQFNRSLAVGDSLELFKKEVDLLKLDLQNRQSVITELKAKVDTLLPAYNHYVTIWGQCDSTLQQREIDIVHLKSSRRNYAIGFGIGGLILGFLLKSIL